MIRLTRAMSPLIVTLLSCCEHPPRDVGSSEGRVLSAPDADEHSSITSGECPTKRLSLGVVNVDFYGGRANIEGPVHVVLCEEHGDSLSPSDVRLMRTEFEVIVRDYYLSAAFACIPDYELSSDLLAVHDETLQRLNAALDRPILLDYGCGLNFSEAM